MNKRVAVMDLGTNTFHLLITEIAGTHFSILWAEQRHVKLGEGGITTGNITEAAFERGLQALIAFKGIIDNFKVDEIKASGTAALRSANNGTDFIQKVHLATSIVIEIIDGDAEATLIYAGVKRCVDLGRSSLIMDIGGGSVEFIFCSAEKIFWKKSYPIGAAKLMAQFHHSDPISNTDVGSITQFLSTQLSELQQQALLFSPEQLVGSAGAFETLAALTNKKQNNNILAFNNYHFNLEDLNNTLRDILQSNHNQRVENPLIIPVRTDMIVVASVLIVFILNFLNIRQVQLSRYALKEGLLFS